MTPEEVKTLEETVPRPIHRWNFWMASTEAALFMAATQFIGPMTLIPFLFRKAGIDQSWLALFMLANLVMAFGGPVGAAIAGGREYKLPFCLKAFVLQRVPFLALPLGIWFLFDQPVALLSVIVAAWFTGNFFGGVGAPAFHVLITNGVWETWWGRMFSMRLVLAAAFSIIGAQIVWAVNRAFAPPTNYVLLGWMGILGFAASWYVISRIREVPIRAERAHGPEGFGQAFKTTTSILRDDPRVRWVVLGRILRSSGFLLGIYMTAFFIERTNATDEIMWVPYLLTTAPGIIVHWVAGWYVDRYGVKPGLIASGTLVAVNSYLIMQCHSVLAFAFLFPLMTLGGSLLMTSWPLTLMKLAPEERRPAYFSAVSLAAAPGSMLILVAGLLLVRATGFEYVFYMSGAGGLLSALLFWWKLPDLRRAPSA